MLKKLITISITAIASLQAATTYDKSLSDGNDDLNYWSDTTSSNLTNHTLVGATEVFTIGSRKNIPNVPTPIKVSTNKLCSNDRLGQISCSKTDSLEPRYTDDGLATSGELNLRTWYKATTPKSVNGVVDDPCTSLSNTGSVVNWAANFPSLRCERTITTYTPKVNSTIYTSKVGSTTSTSSVVYANKIANTTTSGGTTVYAAKIATTTSSPASSANKYRWKVQSIKSTESWNTPQSFYQYSPTKAKKNGDFMDHGGITQASPHTTTYYEDINGCRSVSAGANVLSSFGSTKTVTVGFYSGMNSNDDSVIATFTCGNYSTGYFCSTGSLIGTQCSTTTYTCPATYTDNGSNCSKTTSGTTTTTYTCPATYTDNGTNCKKTITGSTITYSCPSGYSDNGSNCKQTIQICPDSSWTNNGTNCRKNVPEYKLFSTF